MYAQFFGNYLLERNAITKKQLISALKKQNSEHLKLGTMAMHAGYMTASEVDNIIILQTHHDMRFGEIAVREGYLTESQVNSLLTSQKPDYLLLGQALIDDNILTNTEFENLMIDYQTENELDALDILSEQKEKLNQIINMGFVQANHPVPPECIDYLSLLFNNLIRFIGDDFTPLSPVFDDTYPLFHTTIQKICGDFTLTSYLDIADHTALSFASRYVGDVFTEFDEYVQSSMEDFLNLHNGLFTVNESNDHSLELSLEPPLTFAEKTLESTGTTFLLPVLYPFGTINFFITIP